MHRRSAGRSKREQVFHDDTANFSQFRRRYRAAFAHANHFRDIQQRTIVGDIFKDLVDGHFLELGSSTWVTWLEENDLKPARLTCINISRAELDRGEALCRGTRNLPEFMLMDAHELDFNGQFRAIFGGGILHHLDLPVALDQIEKHLEDDGKAVFFEPLDVNPVARIVRKLTPRSRTPDETPFRKAQIDELRKRFDCQFYPLQFLVVPLQLVSLLIFKDPENFLMRSFTKLDDLIVRLWPGSWMLHRYFIVAMTKKHKSGNS